MKKQNYCHDCNKPVSGKAVFCYECQLEQTQKETLLSVKPKVRVEAATVLSPGEYILHEIADDDLVPCFNELDEIVNTVRRVAYAHRDIKFVKDVIAAIRKTALENS